ncbi:MAG: hypothetical protein H7174_07220 [Flavobacterium sp.]|nr:hypothetical protein [Flavobacterium sp.]
MLFFNHFFIFLFSVICTAQQDGYWDKERSTNKQIIVSAGKKIIIESENFPVGTTEIVYRISILDENQQLASSLVDVLKSIPDPTGISKGSAGAVFLLSKVAGDDKCVYNILTLEKYANEFKKTGKNDKACFMQNTPINKEAKLLSLGKSSCLTYGTENLYFGFESKNWVMNQKIILEIVPWVDKKLSRGWNSQNKQIILNQCKLSETAIKLQNSDNFCVCQLNKIQEKYKFFEFNNLLFVEKNNYLKLVENDCLNKTGDKQYLVNEIRTFIDSLIESKKYDLAIKEFQKIIKNGNEIANDFNNLGTCYLLTKQYQKALVNFQKASSLDNTELLFQLNLAHAFMFTNDIKSAKKIHEKFKNQNINSSTSWLEKTKSDFNLFRKMNLPTEDFNKVFRIID